jgi:1-deoxy-D-xylulose-5-phosphate synthase
MILQKLRSVSELKKMSVSQLEALAAEIRPFLIQTLSHTGGHLASNLGVVELTLALHSVYDSPRDKIIWDVGHQTYVHKILTGRRDAFGTLRRLGGLSGFPKPGESVHDVFGTGHSSTAISAALGFAAARDVRLGKHHVVAVAGDGSMTGGLAYEALNNAGRANTDVLVILNDNQMSIAESVGAISRHLNDIRTAPFYLGAKQDIHKVLDHIPLVGKPAAKFIEHTKDALKFLLLPGVLFEELGFQYFGPVDGHDLRVLTDVLRKMKNIKGPVLLHVRTVKGKGYEAAEHAPVNFHGIGAFCVETGQPEECAQTETYTDVFGKTLVRLAKNNPDIVAITAAMPDGTGLCPFKKRYPERFFDVGIAESHAVTFAAGLAKAGMRPVAAVYSSFLQRAYDQILHDVCLQNLPVVFAVDRAGVVGPDGETHQGLFDLSYLSHMPNMTVMAPKNKNELVAMLAFAFKHNGPVAVRYPRSAVSNALPEHNAPIIWGRAETVFSVDTTPPEKANPPEIKPTTAISVSVALVSVGSMMDTALLAAEELRRYGINVGLYNARFIKPLDMGLVAALSGYDYVYSLEENVRSGGYGARLSEALPRTVPFRAFAFPDTFVEQGTRDELFKRYKLDAESIILTIKNNFTKEGK